MSELLPCPFCGGEAELAGEAEPYHRINAFCIKCGAQTRIIRGSIDELRVIPENREDLEKILEKITIETWNKRA